MAIAKFGRLLALTVIVLASLLTGSHETTGTRKRADEPLGLLDALLRLPVESSTWRYNLKVVRLPELAVPDTVDAADVAALWSAIEREPDEDRRQSLVAKIVASGSISEERMASAVERFAVRVATAGRLRDRPGIGQFGLGDGPVPGEISLGKYLAETAVEDERLAARLFDRERQLRRSDPRAAAILARILYTWPVPAAGRALLDRVERGDSTVEIVVAVVERAELLRATEAPRLRALVEAGGFAGGVAAAVLGDEATTRRVLTGEDVSAACALLACARLARSALPVDLVGALLGPYGDSAYASRRYLEVEDSPEARRLLLAHAVRRAHIVGGRVDPIGDDSREASLVEIEERLRDEVLADGGPREILALLPDIVVRVWPDRAEVTRSEVVYLEAPMVVTTRVLDAKELAELQRFVQDNRVVDLPVYEEWGRDHGFSPQELEFLRLSRDGGVRVHFRIVSFWRRPPEAAGGDAYEEVRARFASLITKDMETGER